ncbi:MAG TPA: metal-dependent hydrolase [Symbiobacteriaceae bacterium]|nr:metal-dependent hydrolase [Symbiobacteriaceae bacterium]
MDNLTHGLLGAAIGMLRLRDGGPERDRPVSHTDKAVVWAAFIASELPDGDIFFGEGPMDYLRIHRGLSHGLVVAPLLALAAAMVTKLVWRQARFWTVFAWSLVSVVLVHLFPDWLTGWGSQLLQPFSAAKLGLDWVPIVDWLALLALLPAVLAAWRKPRLRRKLTAGVLAFVAVYWLGYRGIAHTLVDGQVAERYDGQPVVQQRVSPNLFNPLAWEYVVDLGDRYELGKGYAWGLAEGVRSVPKAPADDVIQAVRTAPELKPFFDHFFYPVMTYTKVPDGFAVELGDVRYEASGRGMRYSVLLSPDLKVISVGGGF